VEEEMRYVIYFQAGKKINPGDVEIRKMNPDKMTGKQYRQLDDLDLQTSRLHRGWDAEFGLRKSKARKPLDKKELKDAGKKGGFLMAAVDKDDNILGYCLSGIKSDYYDSLCWLNDLVVDESARGLGLGKRLVRETLKELKFRGYKHVVLNVSLRNDRALGLYEKTGFRPWEYTMVKNL
jgi:ribosomal protein S18 acetylase RimI-like enzyme